MFFVFFTVFGSVRRRREDARGDVPAGAGAGSGGRQGRPPVRLGPAGRDQAVQRQELRRPPAASQDRRRRPAKLRPTRRQEEGEPAHVPPTFHVLQK